MNDKFVDLASLNILMILMILNTWTIRLTSSNVVPSSSSGDSGDSVDVGAELLTAESSLPMMKSET